MTPVLTDSMLIEAARRGDQSAYAALVARYQAAVCSTVRRTLGRNPAAEDAVQEVFLRALVSLPRFDCRLPFGPWILIENPALDAQVRKFLNSRTYQWHQLNIPAVDGQLLYDLIIKNQYKSALEIGTSTGHSGIWIAWALSKTGGKLITIEIDPARHKEALANFKEAGLADYIDARLADAHKLVPELSGPFDFVFSDADKEWYKNYFMALSPKLTVGGCFTSHNVSRSSGRRRYGEGGSDSYLQYLLSLPNFETTVNSAGGGVAISYKRAAS